MTMKPKNKKIVLRFRSKDKQIFNDIKKRIKTVETRAATEKFKNIQKGDKIIFICGKNKFQMTAKKVMYFKSVNSMIKSVNFKKIMPRVKDIDELKKIYYSFSGYREKIKKSGIVALNL